MNSDKRAHVRNDTRTDTRIPTLLAQALQQLLQDATGGQDRPAILLPPAAAATAPALLARRAALQAGQAGSGRAVVLADHEDLYSRCLALYRQRVQAVAAQDDLGRAAALFVMANLGAMGRVPGVESGESGDDTRTLDALTQQMQNALQRLPDWSNTTLQARQQLFEQLALLSVLVAQSAQAAALQGPLARAHVRAAAQGYLRQWLTVDPALLGLSATGLVVAPAAAATLARRLHKALAA